MLFAQDSIKYQKTKTYLDKSSVLHDNKIKAHVKKMKRIAIKIRSKVRTQNIERYRADKLFKNRYDSKFEEYLENEEENFMYEIEMNCSEEPFDENSGVDQTLKYYNIIDE